MALTPRKNSGFSAPHVRNRWPTWIARTSPVFALAAAVACSSAGDSDSTDGLSAIYGGSASGPEDDAVVYIQSEVKAGTLSTCTGALVATNLVLTALHCVARGVSIDIACDENGKSFNGDHVGESYGASGITVLTGATTKTKLAKVKEVVRPSTNRICNSDIAFLVLDKDVTSLTPLKVRYKTPVKKGESFTAIGYGVNDTGAAESTRLRRKNVMVRATGPNVSEEGLPIASREFEVTQAACRGDSGGPALSTATGAVLGVVSRGGDCKSDFGQVYTMAYDFAELFGRAETASGKKIVDESETSNETEDAGTKDAGPSEPSDAGPVKPGDAGPDQPVPPPPSPPPSQPDASAPPPQDAGPAPMPDAGKSDAGRPDTGRPDNDDVEESELESDDESDPGTPRKRTQTPRSQVPSGYTKAINPQGCSFVASTAIGGSSSVGRFAIAGLAVGLLLARRRRQRR
jgi:hypothetical protein